MRRRLFLRRAAVAAAGLATGAAAWKGCRVDPRDLRVVRVRVPCPGLSRGEVRVLVFADIDWPDSREVWKRIPAIARGFAPDLLLLPGDLLDRASTTGDAVVSRAVGSWLRSLAPGVPILVAPGEAESEARERLARAWEGRVAIPANEARRYEVRGAPLEVFVVDPGGDPAAWCLAREDGRPVARLRGRTHGSRLAWSGDPAVAAGLEAIVRFRIDDPDASIEFRILDAWRLRTRPGRRAFTLQRAFRSTRPLSGRTASPFAPPIGDFCRARLRWEPGPDGATVRAKFWIDGSREPSAWSIDVVDPDPAYPTGPALAVVGRRGRLALGEVSVATLDGRVALEERFDDPGVFRARWSQNSALAAWARSAPLAPTRIVLAHHPDVVLALAEGDLPRPDLVIAGHTHGGQIRLPGFGPLLTDTRLGRRYDRGVFAVEGMRLFVTAGVGTSIVPVRWNVPPDVAELTLVPGRREDPTTLLDSAAPEANP